ncbi:hypothetical protein BBJ29_009153, partial [Phytophthora kernoviae]
TEVPDDTIAIEFGEDRKEELGGSTVEESVDASVKVEASVADVDEGSVNDITLDASEEVTLSEFEEMVNAGKAAAVVDDELNEPQEMVPEVPISADDAESGGLASAVNEVLARLVEPFESRKTAMPVVAEDDASQLVADEH